MTRAGLPSPLAIPVLREPVVGRSRWNGTSSCNEEFDSCRVTPHCRSGRKAGAWLPHSTGRRGDRRKGAEGDLAILWLQRAASRPQRDAAACPEPSRFRARRRLAQLRRLCPYKTNMQEPPPQHVPIPRLRDRRNYCNRFTCLLRQLYGGAATGECADGARFASTRPQQHRSRGYTIRPASEPGRSNRRRTSTAVRVSR
jgi:hypothetical protein